MGRWPPRLPSSKFMKDSDDYCNRFVREGGAESWCIGRWPARSKFIRERVDYCIGLCRKPESWNMGRWPPRPPRSKFIREIVDYCKKFVREYRTLECGPVAVKAAHG